jgi:predicted metal-binding protein
MGMFDRVIFTCPNCQARIEEQSKAGTCSLLEFNEREVPIAIAGEIKGNTVHCDNCKETFVIMLGGRPDVPMYLVKKTTPKGDGVNSPQARL